MNIYLLTQSDNTGYDTYSACVVAAESEDKARKISPSGDFGGSYPSWANSPNNVEVSLLGTAVDGTVECEILSSFHAG